MVIIPDIEENNLFHEGILNFIGYIYYSRAIDCFANIMLCIDMVLCGLYALTCGC